MQTAHSFVSRFFPLCMNCVHGQVSQYLSPGNKRIVHFCVPLIWLFQCTSISVSVINICVCDQYKLEQGHRRQGRPCKRFKDTVKAGLQWCDIPPTELVATALDRQRWRTLTQSASSALEEERRHQAQSARERRHLAASIPATNANFQCPDCARLCKSRIGLQSHSRTHR